MRTRMALRNGVVALVFLLGTASAQAVGTAQAGFEVVTNQLGTNATGILNLEVDGVLYDVEFDFDFGLDIFGDPPFTFNNELQALNPNEEVNFALNSEPMVTTVGPMRSAVYVIPFEFENLDYVVRASDYSIVLANWVQVQDAQLVYGSSPSSYAVFTVVPAAATMCLFGPAILALASRRR